MAVAAPASPRPLSLAVLLTWAFAGLVVYATLYPFEGWQWPQKNPSRVLLLLPFPRYQNTFDNVANLIGYGPLGLLAYVAAMRRGRGPRLAWVLAALGPSLMSYALEFTQQFLPTRVPSILDWILNSAGAAAGATTGALLRRLGLDVHWQAFRERWFVDHSSGAVLLLLLWPAGLLFPAPFPLGVGDVLDWLVPALAGALDGTPWAGLLDRSPFLDAAARAPMSGLAELLGIAFGLLAPCLLAYSIARTRWRRAAMAVGAAITGVAVTTLSAALHFGPDHALAWITPLALPGIAAGLALALGLVWLPGRAAAALGLVVGTILVALVAQAPADAYFAASLQAWEQGRFIRFHGGSQWVGRLWPYAMLLVLLVRISRREPA